MGVFCRLPMRAFPKCSACRVGAGWVALGNVWWGSRCYLYKIKKKIIFLRIFRHFTKRIFFIVCAIHIRHRFYGVWGSI